MAQFDVRCDRCGEEGSVRRMDLEDGVCFYCREEQSVEPSAEERQIAQLLAPDILVQEISAWFCGRVKDLRKQEVSNA